MNTGKLERFAKTARLILLDGVERKIRYWGFDEKGNSSEQPVAIQGGYIFRGQVYDDPDVPSQWLSLQAAIHSTSFQEIIEKASYVWFNRMVAIKILSKNGYEPAMLDYQDEQVLTPQLLVKARRGQYQYLNEIEKSRLNTVISDYSNELRAFGILLIGYCHNNILLSKVFGLIDDYTELLLPDDILSENGFLNLLNTSDAISDEDYRQVELIGWLYQFYISDKKDEVFKGFKNNKKAEARDIPAATQIFTPNWIVKYMVQNTVGRIWLDHKPGSPLREKMKYLVDSPNTENLTTVTSSIISEVSNLKLLDPASGSGHILVEGFDLLFDMYLEEYYSSSDAIESILQNNLYGLDIDLRAAQLARFAILLKAAPKYPDILKKGIMPQVYAMPEPCEFSRQEILDFLGSEGVVYEKHLSSVLDLMQQAQNLGSIMNFGLSYEARNFIVSRLEELQQKLSLSFHEQAVLPRIIPFIKVFSILSQQYEAVAANPPYMGSKSMNDSLKQYINSNYPFGKSDFMTVFMELLPKLVLDHGRFSMINMPSWLFLSSFEALRKEFLCNFYIESLLHMGRGIFGIDFGSVAFSIKKEEHAGRKGNYFRLHERNFQHIYYTDIEKLFLFSKDKPTYRYDFTTYRNEDGKTEISKLGTLNGLKLNYPDIPQSNFSKIPSSPIVFWVSEKTMDHFVNSLKISDSFESGGRIKTHDNEFYSRFFWEISNLSIGRHENWIFVENGGEIRKWYGNLLTVIKWSSQARDYYSSHGGLSNSKYWSKIGISWSIISSQNATFRLKGSNCEFTSASPTILPSNSVSSYYVLAFLNSKYSTGLLKIINPTVNTTVGDVLSLPLIHDEDKKKVIEKLSTDSINKSKLDWDSREFSWDFQKHPLLNFVNINLEKSYFFWLKQISADFFHLHHNEEELNSVFIEIYDLLEELTPEVQLKDITILQEEIDSYALEQIQLPYEDQLVPVKKEVIMQQLISYAIGCFMGRYCLDKPGLQIAYPNPTAIEIAPYNITSPLHSETGKIVQFEIDDDAIIPIMGNNGVFTDDALIRIKAFIELVWGEETLSQNLNFLQQALNKDIEDYLVKDFWKYHCRVYSKRPIYWLFSSPKGAFQVLVYMHRMNKFTPDKIRTKYLLRHIQYLRNESGRLSSQSSTLSRDEERRLEKLLRDLQECEEYDILLKSLGTIEFDLDDGVVKNYALFKGVVAEIK